MTYFIVLVRCPVGKYDRFGVTAFTPSEAAGKVQLLLDDTRPTSKIARVIKG